MEDTTWNYKKGVRFDFILIEDFSYIGILVIIKYEADCGSFLLQKYINVIKMINFIIEKTYRWIELIINRVSGTQNNHVTEKITKIFF